MLLPGLGKALAARPASAGAKAIAGLPAAALTVCLSACLAYQPPSGRGYDYDRGRTMARNDVDSGRLVYLVAGDEARDHAALGRRIEANCGFAVRLAYSDAEAERRKVEFAQGYNAVSVPVIEQRLGSPIGELMKRCAQGPKR